jgi:predicted transcriptional regulator
MTTIDIPDTMMEQFEQIAAVRQRSKSQLVTEALENYLSYEAYARAHTLQGLAEAERGEFASEEELKRVLSKYDHDA